MNKKKNQKINIKRIKRIRRIKKSIITMVLLGVVLGLMAYIPINIKKKALIARDVVASEKFKDDINVLGTFNRLREDNKSIYASDEVSIKINSEIEEILEELKNGVTDKVKELVDNLNSLLVDVSAGNHSELEQLFNKLNEDKMTGFTQEEVKKVNTLMDEYNLLIKEQKYSEAKVDLEDINTYVKEVKKIVETRITKEEYDKKSTEDEKSRKATYINGILLVNKKNGLPDSFGDAEDPKAREAFEEMKKAAGKDGLYINAFSTYRSFWTQNRLYWNYVASFGQEPTDTFSARAGFSEHQTGLGFDVGGADRSLWANQEFQYTAEAEWLKNNCYKYGFILRYPEGKEWKTGFVYESWHFRYLGEEHSKNFNNNNLTLEEYLGV
ncbi:M15 family metallopeptidase [Clostridium gasigenes]|uniref:D-alanyl-D-alanine carboxypeptidase n=1 Tax=Clostridium gasigenes TaxID=94869 RepID=A0A1H0MTJ5_9CLOT|nr:M15 family metallopeptidase [Clostridium gasigenes]SDO83625.1 D-alanyl-D-alanine carboxypeptidase [Clostridium gasigenes]